jgi:hypothetical protein
MEILIVGLISSLWKTDADFNFKCINNLVRGNFLTPCMLAKLTVTRLVKISPDVFETRRFITVLTGTPTVAYEPPESNPHHFNIILHVVPFVQHFRLQICTHLAHLLHVLHVLPMSSFLI